MQKRRGLGKGLAVLLSDDATVATREPAQLSNVLAELPLNAVVVSPFQPRREMAEGTLAELAQSIVKQGVIQPIVVRQKGEKYELIAGERRWRAAAIAGLKTIPALVHVISDEKAMLCALVENVQREDLNPLDAALALNKIAENLHYTHEQLAATVGKSRATITNLLRLLQLNERVKNLLQMGRLDMGHARALLALPVEKQAQVADQIIERHLSVRATEALVQFLLAERTPRIREPRDNELFRLQKKIGLKLGLRTVLKQQASGQGKITIEYKDQSELARFVTLLEET